MSAAKLFHIRSSYFYGGPERQITYLTRSLADRGIESAVATFAPKNDPDRNKYFSKLKELDFPSFRIDIAGSFDSSPTEKMGSIIRDNDYNLLVGHDYRADYFVLQLSKKLRLPAISFSRGWTRNTFKVRFYEWLDRRFLKKMDGVVAVSRAKFEELTRRGISADRMIYIPNSILTDNVVPRSNIIRDKFNIPHDAFLIGTAGRLSIEKNQEMLIKAAITLLENDKIGTMRFILAGEGPLREKLAGLIPDKFKDKIIPAGWIEDNESFYADIDLFVLTSQMEGFPNVLLEAGKYSLPAISTPAGGAVEIIDDGQTGRLIPFGDSGALVEAIASIYGDSSLRREMGDALGRITREKFDARINAGRFLEFADRIRERYEEV
jgi:glycosyltransferase involved in cell wall biosynthesis